MSDNTPPTAPDEPTPDEPSEPPEITPRSGGPSPLIRLMAIIDWSRDWPYLLGMVIMAFTMQLYLGTGSLSGMNQGFTDSYTYMVRLIETDWWSSRGWMPQYNAPDGMLLHWAYPFSALVTLLAVPFAPFMDWPDALLSAGVISSFLCSLVVGVIAYYLALTINTKGWAMIAAILVMGSRPVMSYGSFGRPDHHMMGLALVGGFWLCLIAIERYRTLYQDRENFSLNNPTYGRFLSYHLLAGLLAGLALWTAPETQAGLVIALAVQCWHRLVVMQDPMPQPAISLTKTQILTAETSFAVTWMLLLLVAVLVDPPYEGLWAAAHDRVSIVHVIFAACTGALIIGRMPLLWGMAARGHTAFVPQMLGLGVLGLLVVGVFLGFFPTAGSGAMNHIAPELSGWINFIQEMQPTYGKLAVSMNLTVPLFGLFYLILLYEDTRDDQDKRHRLIVISLIAGLCVITIIGAMYFRFLYFSALATAPFAAAFLARLGRTKWAIFEPDLTVPLVVMWPFFMFYLITLMTGNGEQIARMFATHNSLNTEIAIENVVLEYDDDGRLRVPFQPTGQAACRSFPMIEHLIEVEDKFRAHGGAEPMIAMFHQNPTPAIAFHTDMHIISAPYHRNTAGLLDERRFFGTNNLDHSYEVIDRRGVDVIGICIKAVIDNPDLDRPAVYDWAIQGGDERFGIALIIPGEWIILARQELLGDWAPVIKMPETDQDGDTSNNS